MKRQINFYRLAELELNRAIIWYAENTSLGRELQADFKATIAGIRKNPFEFPVSFGTARRALLTRFPYKIFFLIADDGVISIYGILHTGQDTNRLIGRWPQ